MNKLQLKKNYKSLVPANSYVLQPNPLAALEGSKVELSVNMPFTSNLCWFNSCQIYVLGCTELFNVQLCASVGNEFSIKYSFAG